MSTTEKTTLHLPGRTGEYLLRKGWRQEQDGLWTAPGGGTFQIWLAIPMQEQWDAQDAAKAPKNDAGTLMAECHDREAAQRAEIMKTPGPIGFTIPKAVGIPEHRATAFVASLQQARIDALEGVLRDLLPLTQAAHSWPASGAHRSAHPNCPTCALLARAHATLANPEGAR